MSAAITARVHRLDVEDCSSHRVPDARPPTGGASWRCTGPTLDDAGHVPVASGDRARISAARSRRSSPSPAARTSRRSTRARSCSRTSARRSDRGGARNNSTERMLALLGAVPGADVGKITTIELSTEDIDPGRSRTGPTCASSTASTRTVPRCATRSSASQRWGPRRHRVPRRLGHVRGHPPLPRPRARGDRRVHDAGRALRGRHRRARPARCARDPRGDDPRSRRALRLWVCKAANARRLHGRPVGLVLRMRDGPRAASVMRRLRGLKHRVG